MLPGSQKIKYTKVHTNEIDVLSWSWGMTNNGSAHVGGGVGSGKVSVQDLTLSKFVDSSSPKLMLGHCNGKHFPDALLTAIPFGWDIAANSKES